MFMLQIMFIVKNNIYLFICFLGDNFVWKMHYYNITFYKMCYVPMKLILVFFTCTFLLRLVVETSKWNRLTIQSEMNDTSNLVFCWEEAL